jgi:hypothetical protein
VNKVWTVALKPRCGLTPRKTMKRLQFLHPSSWQLWRLLHLREFPDFDEAL